MKMLAFCRGKILLCKNVTSKYIRKKIKLPCNVSSKYIRKKKFFLVKDTPPNTLEKNFFLVIMIHLQNTFLLALYIIGINHVAT